MIYMCYIKSVTVNKFKFYKNELRKNWYLYKKSMYKLILIEWVFDPTKKISLKVHSHSKILYICIDEVIELLN